MSKLGKSQTVLIWVDASSQTGMGHAVRSLAVAAAFRKKGCAVRLLATRRTRGLPDWMRQNGFEGRFPDATDPRAEAAELKREALDCDARIVYLDLKPWSRPAGALDAAWTDLRNAGVYLIAMDPLDRADFPFDLVVLPFWGAEAFAQKCRPESRVLEGLRYFVFRDEFRAAAREPRTYEKKGRILVSMGGSDPGRITEKVAEWLVRSNRTEAVYVVLGPGFEEERRAALVEILSEYSGPFEILRDPPGLSRLMKESDVALTSGGSTKFEAALLGVPALVFSQNELEDELTRSFESTGCIRYLGRGGRAHPELFFKELADVLESSEKRERMGRAGRALLDGRGLERIFEAIPEEALASCARTPS